jgi:HEAT repeat protein
MKVLAESGNLEYLSDVVQSYRRLSRREIDQLGDALGGFGQAIRENLAEMLRSARGYQVVGALRALVRLDQEEAALPLIEEVVKGRRGIWREAARLLAGLRRPPVASMLEVSRDQDPGVRGRMVAALSSVSDTWAQDRLRDMAKSDPTPTVRSAARRALADG